MKFAVTGGSRGIGAALVTDLVESGHDVAFTYCASRDAALALQKTLTANRPEVLCTPYQLDVRDGASVEAFVDGVAEDFELIDAVVLNAGISKSGLAVAMSDEDWQEVIEVNLSGVFYVCRQFLPLFLAQKHGRFIHISSVAREGMAGLSAYAASKAGLNGFSSSLAKEYGRKGITSNVLSLGYFETEMTQGQMPEQHRKFWMDFCPTGRIGKPGDISSAVLYLASPDAGFVNGQTISVTGGLDWGP